ncbi:hypothetical protein BJX61DRAFT_541185 [Aspergillus egyptiacus]|nr:hypothetical protein BJX61DRAFT_541185 [Aspergillus egyptiacus]
MYDGDNNPHSMFTLVNEVDGDNERLLRGELLTIMKVMALHLGNEFCEGQNIFPIMVFSFMGTQGRILQAHFNDDGLAVYTSRLYNFSTREEADNSMQTFLRYMCSEPKGVTVSQVPFDRRVSWRKEHNNLPRPVMDFFEYLAAETIRKHWK